MTRDQIEELFIKSAETDRRLPDTARPARLKAQALPYVNDWQDKLGWGSEALENERLAFWDSRSTRLRSADVSRWELCNALIVLVRRARDRRCLWNWAISKAGGKPFSKWCRDVEHVSRNYGLECRTRAILEITLALDCKPLQHNENGRSASLQRTLEMGDKDVILANDVPTYWRAPDARPMACDFDKGLQSFEWAELQNERRRQRDAEKRKRQVAA